MIKKQAKRILDSFAKALDKVKVEESKVERPEDRRIEEEGLEGDKDFREIMFSNAGKTKGDCIEAEKGEWAI